MKEFPEEVSYSVHRLSEKSFQFEYEVVFQLVHRLTEKLLQSTELVLVSILLAEVSQMMKGLTEFLCELAVRSK